jgi:hypothetical protein
MTISRTTISAIEGAPLPVFGLADQVSAGRRVRDAALAVVTVGLLLLVAF